MLEEPLSILITDDIRMNRIMLKRRLQKCIAPNCIIQEAATGEEALQLCASGEAFDIIIMDQYMEEAGGLLLGTDAIIAMRRTKLQSLIIGYPGMTWTICFGPLERTLFGKSPFQAMWKSYINYVRTWRNDQELYKEREKFGTYQADRSNIFSIFVSKLEEVKGRISSRADSKK